MLASHAHPAYAQSLETAIMPGAVIQGHAKYESECKRCHVRFDREGQVGLCLDCHKEVAKDVRGKTGYHGRIKERVCRTCHTEHKGRGMNIVILDEKKFDHEQTDYALCGKHVGVACLSCHRARTKYRAAPSNCISCHRKDDKHKDNLGPKCESCHEVKSWKEARFDHDKARFPLVQKHIKVKCAECHTDLQHYANIPRDCHSCHRKDDFHKGRFGPRCETCHDAGNWKLSKFRHDHDTRYVLRDSHRTVKCESCHRAPVAQEKTPTSCNACHRRDDVHKGALGEKCDTCHAATKWKQSGFDHDRDNRYPLREKHRTVKCSDCHKDTGFREKVPSACYACHERDERDKGHNGKLGNKCESCHTERGWRETSFDHRQSTYPLRGRHAGVKCGKCHTGREYAGVKSDCASCHLKDDYHKERLGPRCEQCHTERDWKAWDFNHDKSRYKLTGAHVRVACRACHTQPVADKIRLAMDCASCHLKKDDVHLGGYGSACERCHVADNWRKIIKRDPLPLNSPGPMQ